jgi:integrase
MDNKVLTQRAIERLQPTDVARYFTIGKIPGLQLRIAAKQHGGAKTWSLRYRVNGGPQRRLALGSFSAIPLTLSEAHKKQQKATGQKIATAETLAKAALNQIENGIDPADERQQLRAADTVEAFAETYIEKYARKHKRTWKTDQGYLNNKVLPRWKHRKMRDITRRDVRELLEHIADHESRVTANRVHSTLSKLFNVAIDREVIDANPAYRVKKTKEAPRDRVLTNDEIRTLWQATEPMRVDMKAMYRLLLILGQRSGEIRNMRWEDIDGSWWTVPAEHSKNGKAHRVYLTPMALDVLATLPKNGPHVLRGTWNKKEESRVHKTIAIPDFRKYPDLKSTMASRMAGELHIATADIGRVLNHTPQNVTEKHYVRTSYDSVKQATLSAWARHLQGILDDENQTNLLPFSKA